MNPQKYEVGEPIPNSPHAVVSNLPTLKNVRDYEEGAPNVVSEMKQGYPRFVRHQWVELLNKHVTHTLNLEGVWSVLVSQTEAIKEYALSLDLRIQVKAIDSDLYGLSAYYIFVDQAHTTAVEALKMFVQHSGCEISSRYAETSLLKLGIIQAGAVPENDHTHQANTLSVQKKISELSEAASSDEVVLTASGMNAFFTAFCAVQFIQRPRGRNVWLQIGWLYVDSGEILKKYLKPEESLEVLYDPLDIDKIIAQIESAGQSLSAVVLECPTNPFCQIADLERLSKAVKKAGGILIVDPSIASFFNINCLKHADVIVTSLTKYSGYAADVLAGALIFNKDSLFYEALIERAKASHVPLFQRDLERLNYVINRAEKFVQIMNQNCKELSTYLKAHPSVKKIYTLRESPNAHSYMKTEDSCGAIISIELKGSMESFYDKIQLVKGPSFGAQFTIICPYFYLAHYDLVKDLSKNGLFNQYQVDRNLIRISVGCEPIEYLLSQFESALKED